MPAKFLEFKRGCWGNRKKLNKAMAPFKPPPPPPPHNKKDQDLEEVNFNNATRNKIGLFKVPKLVQIVRKCSIGQRNFFTHSVLIKPVLSKAVRDFLVLHVEISYYPDEGHSTDELEGKNKETANNFFFTT